MKAHTHSRSRRRPQRPAWDRPKAHLDVQYHPGVEGVDNILRPSLLSVGGGTCFRLVKESWPWGPEGIKGEELAATSNRRPHADDTYDEGEEPLSELQGVVQLPGGRYSLSLAIPDVFFKYIIGRFGSTCENIERDTKCRLTIPRRGARGDIVIEGDTTSAVAHAKRRVEMVAWTHRFNEEPTHFLSIPLNSPTVMERFRRFKEEALASCGKHQGIQDGAFKAPEKLHLTLGIVRIFSKEEEEKAVMILRKVVSDAKERLGAEPVRISLQGLDCMNDDITAARVIYAKVKASTRLQDFVDEINSSFIAEGPELMRNEFEREGVKLHATVLNSKFLERLEGGGELEVYRGKKREQPWMTINASGLFKEFKNYDFGEVQLSRVHLSKRSEFDRNGYYKCVHEYVL